MNLPSAHCTKYWNNCFTLVFIITKEHWYNVSDDFRPSIHLINWKIVLISSDKMNDWFLIPEANGLCRCLHHVDWTEGKTFIDLLIAVKVESPSLIADWHQWSDYLNLLCSMFNVNRPKKSSFSYRKASSVGNQRVRLSIAEEVMLLISNIGRALQGTNNQPTNLQTFVFSESRSSSP